LGQTFTEWRRIRDQPCPSQSIDRAIETDFELIVQFPSRPLPGERPERLSGQAIKLHEACGTYAATHRLRPANLPARTRNICKVRQLYRYWCCNRAYLLSGSKSAAIFPSLRRLRST